MSVIYGAYTVLLELYAIKNWYTQVEEDKDYDVHA